MKSHPSLYTEEEKKLLMDFFLFKTQGSKQNFNKYLENFIKEYGEEVAEEFKKPIQCKTDSVYTQLNNWRYNTHHVKWSTDDNIVTFMLSHKKFVVSNAQLKNLNKLHPDWNYQNKNGDTALHIMAKNGEVYLLKQLLNDFPLNVELKNKSNEQFVFYLFNKDDKLEWSNELNPRNAIELLVKKMAYLDTSIKIFNQYQVNLENISKNKILKFKITIEEIKENLFEYLNFLEEKDPGLDKGYAVDKLDELFNDLEKMIAYYYLDKNINRNKTTSNSRVKI
jgi:ankyrin repeat protein